MQLLEAIQILKTLTKEVNGDLARYEENDTAKDFIIKKLNNQINKLNFTINLVTEFLTQQQAQEQKTAQAAKKRTDYIDKLELICLMHGIFDYNYYTQMSLQMLKEEVQSRLNPQPTIRTYCNDPKFEDLILSIEQMECIKTIAKPIGIILAEGEKPAYLGTTNRPITSFK